MRRLKKLFGGSTALIGVVIVAWQSVAIYFHLTGRIEGDPDQLPLGLSITLLVFGLVMLIGGYWARRDG